ncbi:MAG TPA: PIN domain-containing protein [Bacillota bacterium]|nr:PIN domain-containing protein [Bacillota bacterium]
MTTSVYIDTSAFLAVLNADDAWHQRAAQLWFFLLDTGAKLFTNSLVLVETHALIQNRLGMDAVRTFTKNVLPVVKVQWMDEPLYQQSLTVLLSANRKNLSLVDCASFVTMSDLNLKKVFTFDAHFSEQGFEVLDIFN